MPLLTKSQLVAIKQGAISAGARNVTFNTRRNYIQLQLPLNVDSVSELFAITGVTHDFQSQFIDGDFASSPHDLFRRIKFTK